MIGRYEWIDNDVIVSFSGDVTLQEMVTAANTIYGDSRFENQVYQIFEMSDILSFNPDQTEVEMVASMDRSASRWNTDLKLAIVATQKDCVDMARQYIQDMSDTRWSVRLFDNLPEAKTWCSK